MDYRIRRRSRVRPYTFTGGRTRSRHPLMVHSLVSTVGSGHDPPGYLLPEARRIYLLCRRSRSVAEIAHELRLPLGVIQVLLSDLAERDLAYIHPSVTGVDPVDRPLLERVLHGLHNLV